jgi:hypothetical protein
MIFPNKNIYVGELKNGKPDGRGTLTFANGDEYVGEFKDGQRMARGLTRPPTRPNTSDNSRTESGMVKGLRLHRLDQ